MASIEEKLRNISGSVYKTAQEKCENIIKEAETETENEISRYKDKCLEKAYNDIQKQLNLARREAESAVLKVKTDAKHNFARKRQKMAEEISDGFFQKFNDFKITEKYGEFLSESVEVSKKYFDASKKFTVCIDFEDAKYKEFLEEKFPMSEVCVLCESDRIYGGVKIMPHGTNQVIDNSVLRAFLNEKELFTGSGKLSCN